MAVIQNAYYALANPLSILLDKPSRGFLRKDLLRVIAEKGIERITFHYAGLDSKLKELKMLAESFPAVPANLDELLRQSANIWFTEERNLEVLIEVNPKAADYFKRRKIFPTQEIRETRPDGSLIVCLKVGHFGEVRETLKMWLPNVRVLEPAPFREALQAEVEGWCRWQAELPRLRCA